MRSAIVFLALLAGAFGAGLVELDVDNFHAVVEKDTRAWVIEFGSKYCESCKQFAPIFHALATKHTALKFGVCYVDAPKGVELAQKFGVMELGLPAVVVIEDASGKFSTIPVEDPSSKDQVLRELKKVVAKLPKREGSYWKVGSEGTNEF
jgi:thioredoxin-like negative regulator of GroEL